MADQFVDLKLDRSLLDPNFESYKLSLDSLPVYQYNVEAEPAVQDLSPDQYSHQHIKAFGVHNHLFSDPFNHDDVYMVDCKGQLLKISTTQANIRPNFTPVLSIPSFSNEKENAVNASVHFTSKEYMILSDGVETYYIVHTGDRKQGQRWEVKLSGTLDDSCAPFSILYSTEEESHCLQAVFLSVDKHDNASSAFITTLHWITFKLDEGNCTIIRTRRLTGASTPEYVFLEKDAITIASEKPFKFLYDSEVEVTDEKKEDWMVVEEESDKKGPLPFYTWSQTMQDLTVIFTIPKGYSKSDICYKLNREHLDLSIKNGPKLLVGHLHTNVDPEGSTWTIEAETQRLTVELMKCEESLWPVVVLGDNRGEMLLDPQQVEAVHQQLQHLTSDQWGPDPNPDNRPPPYNAQQLEDCDIFPDENATLVRLDGSNHKPTHQVNLGSHKCLFNTTSRPPCVCLRYDVDGIVWKPLCNPPPGKSPFEHVDTFNALGYVAASKRDCKFSMCSPNLSYAALVDCMRHIYIYRKPEKILSPLRNRKTGLNVGSIAKQQLVTLDSSLPILGAQAFNQVIIVLTKSTLFLLKVKTDQE